MLPQSGFVYVDDIIITIITSGCHLYWSIVGVLQCAKINHPEKSLWLIKSVRLCPALLKLTGTGRALSPAVCTFDKLSLTLLS